LGRERPVGPSIPRLPSTNRLGSDALLLASSAGEHGSDTNKETTPERLWTKEYKPCVLYRDSSLFSLL